LKKIKDPWVEHFVQKLKGNEENPRKKNAAPTNVHVSGTPKRAVEHCLLLEPTRV
jgi:hypothetical protein